MSDQSQRSVISYLEPISGPMCTCILKLSTAIQYIMYPPTLFYYFFSQYTTYVNLLKRNEIQILVLSIATKYPFLGLHHLVQCTYSIMAACYWNAYAICIHTLDTEFMYWIWHMTHEHEACTMYFIFNAVQHHTIHTVTITTIKYWVSRK